MANTAFGLVFITIVSIYLSGLQAHPAFRRTLSSGERANGGGCPFASTNQNIGEDRGIQYNEEHGVVDYDAVKADIIKTLTESQDFWPADFGNYGPLMIRLAWHCAGSYRKTDGRGGCDGARIRFNPERSWPDNTNLDKALLLLEPIKLKYGPKLSWGDLIILSGTTAIESMGGPVLGFCGGRLDDASGANSLTLGPSPEQKAIIDCKVNGNCTSPLGPTTIGLIYVNPEGPMGVPDPKGSVSGIRDTFDRMGMDDRETVALIGGGHAFGKTHGACPTGPGPDPTEDPANPYPGTCGTGPLKGKGPNTYTSGFEGSWTTRPTTWSNDFFKNLLTYNFTKAKGPGDHFQWFPDRNSSIRMLTSDIALLHDESYLALVHEFANNLTALSEAFSHAWYKLATRDMGPIVRCRGNHIPPVQPFQKPLPPPPCQLVDFTLVKRKIKDALYKSVPGVPSDTAPNGNSYFGALFATLAWQCASTYRATDYSGGCNGARIRFPPASEWPSNAGMDQVLQVLGGIKDQFALGLSWADLIVLAGQTAIEEAAGITLHFKGGRTDAKDGSGTEEPRDYYTNPIVAARDNMKIMGLSAYAYVALAGRPRSPIQQRRLGYHGSYTADPTKLSNRLFIALLSEKWEAISDNEFKASGKEIYVEKSDLVLIWDPEYRAIVEQYASDEEFFKHNFASAWTSLVNAGLYDVPCNGFRC